MTNERDFETLRNLGHGTVAVKPRPFERSHAYAIVRLDEFLAKQTASLENCFSIKKIVSSHEEAVREVSRLNGLQAEGVKYFYQIARLPVVVYDESGNGNHGTCINFDGTDDFVAVQKREEQK